MRNEVKELFEEILCNASVSQTWCMCVCVCVEGGRGGGGRGEGRGALDSNVLRNEVKDLFEILCDASVDGYVCVCWGGGGGALDNNFLRNEVKDLFREIPVTPA